MSELEIFLQVVGALANVTQLMIAQDQRLRQFPIRETRSSGSRPDLPPAYIQELEKCNREALAAGKAALSQEISVPTELSNQFERKIPDAVRIAMEAQIQHCWNQLVLVLGNTNLSPTQRKLAHNKARQCVCNELEELTKYLGTLPADLQGYWNACGCPNPQIGG